MLDGLLVRYGALVVVHGAAPGADTIAHDWCAGRAEVDERPYPAHWRHSRACAPGCVEVTGKPAGMIRNRRMLEDEEPAVVFAFRADGPSPGTDGMLDLAAAAGTPYYVTRRG